MTRRRKLIAGTQARQTARQHGTPCSDCPWTRESLPGWLGSLSAQQWIAAAHGEARAECHALTGPHKPHQCAGFAIYRANVCKTPRDPDALRLPADTVRVFESPAEFLAHHERAGLTEALRDAAALAAAGWTHEELEALRQRMQDADKPEGTQ